MSIRGSSSLRLLKVVSLSDNLLLLEIPPNHEVFSNAINWGHQRYRYVAIARVSKDFDVRNPREVIEVVSREYGLNPSETLIMITATNIRNSLVVKSVDSPVAIDVVATVGLEPPACIDVDRVYRPLGASTINIVVSVDEGMAPPGLADLFKLVIEAKCVTIAAITLRCKSLAFGTLTDAIAVTSRRGSTVCSGVATDIGNVVAKLVREVLVETYRRLRDVVSALSDVLGLSIEELVDEAMRAYRQAPIPGVREDEVSKEVKNVLEEMLSDPNVWCFILAARYLDDRGYMGTLWRLPLGEYEIDSPRIVADEIIGMSLASYVHGYRAVFATYWIERLKSRGILKRVASLPMFLDDVASALIASALAMVYTKYLKEVGHEL